MPENATWTLIGESVQQLSLAVSLRDDLTGARPVGSPEVRVDGQTSDVRNVSGYHLYFGLPDDATVTIEVTPDERYEAATKTRDLSTHTVSEAVTFDLIPTLHYTFPSWATLLRGRVVDGDDDPIKNVTLSVDTLSRTTTTNETGEFVYYFTDVTANTTTSGGQTVLELDGLDPTVTATHPDGRTQSATPTVEVAATTSLTFTFA
ncbi:MAG: carboxypeptidase-like regulatory domain-containing protein [Halobacteriales archaeon]|nr:carboxypeptidase-like regulatory domain-containing protein [Halobacteriales archaeon]